MTRLFLRFYLGVLLILTAAWLLQTWLYGERLGPMYANVIRDVYFGGIRIARQKYKFGQELERRGDKGAEERLFNEIKDQYDFPVRLHKEDPRWDFGEREDRVHLCRGIDHGFGKGTFIMARLREGREPVLLFGPLPEFGGPPTFEVLLGLGAVLGLTALAIAMLLRPVMKQFQLVEKTAQSIARGDLGARVEAGWGVASSKLVHAFNNMAARTEQMVRTQEELLQAVSHELRTPLSRIHFATDLIRTASEASREEKLQALESAADDLDKIVGELMTYVRADNEPVQQPTAIELAPILDAIFAKNGILFPAIDFQVGDGARAARLTADPDGFDRVMTNLITNATRFARRTVCVNAHESGGQVLVDVDDDGVGIAEADRERVFDPFVRLTESGTGVGLGLAIVRRIVERNGGSICITESPAGGCRVRTFWPAERRCHMGSG